MTDLISVSVLEQPEIKAAFSKTARTDLLTPVISYLNELKSVDPVFIRQQLNILGANAEDLTIIPQSPALVNLTVMNLLAFQALSNEVEAIRQTLNSIVSSLKNLKVST